MADKIVSANRYLSSEDTGATLGFAAGFLWTNESLKDSVENPLVSTFWGAIGGTVCAFGAGFVQNMMPDKFRFVPSALLISSIGYTLFTRVKANDLNKKYQVPEQQNLTK